MFTSPYFNNMFERIIIWSILIFLDL